MSATPDRAINWIAALGLLVGAATAMAPAIGWKRGLLIRCDGGAHLRGRSTSADRITASVLRLPGPRCHLVGVGMDAGARGAVTAGLRRTSARLREGSYDVERAES